MIRKSFLSAVILVTAFCFTACGKPQTTNEIVTTSTTDTQVQTTPDALSTTEVEVTEQEVAEPEVVEPEVLTLEDWAKSVQTTEVVFGIYNENTNEGKLLETAELDKNTIDEVVDEYISLEKYSVTDGDLLVIVCPGTGHIEGGITFNVIKYGDFYGVYKTNNISDSFYFGYDGFEYKVKYDFN